jgi:hypothetical protein
MILDDFRLGLKVFKHVQNQRHDKEKTIQSSADRREKPKGLEDRDVLISHEN